MAWKLFGKKEPWYANGIVYQIYPWSFKDGNDDGIGDLEGIISKLDYLAGDRDSLGVDAIWLCPIYPSPMKDFGYDVADYYGIDPRFGTLDTFDRLIKECSKRGLKVIMDLVTNHTSSEHPWFKESRSSRKNPKRDWYVWRDPKANGAPPNNWISVSGGPAWTFDEPTGQYYLHNFLKEQPDLNWRNPAIKAEMRKVIRFWLNRGVAGFRVDAMSHFVEDSQLRDDPANPLYSPGVDNPYKQFVHTYSDNQSENADIVKFLCDEVAEFKNTFIVTESYLGLIDLMKMYKAVPVANHAPFNFNFLDLPWSAREYKAFIDAFDALVGPHRIATYVFGNHDQRRLASRLGEKRSRVAAMIMLTLRGMPFMYYGDEIGMKDINLAPEDFRDGFATATATPSASRDLERSPMQWSAEPHAGFSKAEPWLPVPNDYSYINVEWEQTDKFSLLNLYRTLIRLRKAHPELRFGSYESYRTSSQDVLLYSRYYLGKKMYVMINFSDAPAIERHHFKNVDVIASTYLDQIKKPTARDIYLRPLEGIIFRAK
jgi:alpha-glucosidase